MKIQCYTLFVVLLLLGCSKGKDQTQYDNMCDLLDQVIVSEKYQTIPPKNRYSYVNEIIEENYAEQDQAFQLWKLVSLSKNEHYYLFKEAVSEEIGTQWECSSMKDIFTEITQ